MNIHLFQYFIKFLVKDQKLFEPRPMPSMRNRLSALSCCSRPFIYTKLVGGFLIVEPNPIGALQEVAQEGF